MPGLADRFAIARALREIGQRIALAPESYQRARAYERAARVLEDFEGDLAPLIESGQLTALPGIGSSLSAVITELYRTGQSSLLERLRRSTPAGVLELRRVPGLTATR